MQQMRRSACSPSPQQQSQHRTGAKNCRIPCFLALLQTPDLCAAPLCTVEAPQVEPELTHRPEAMNAAAELLYNIKAVARLPLPPPKCSLQALDANKMRLRCCSNRLKHPTTQQTPGPSTSPMATASAARLLGCCSHAVSRCCNSCKAQRDCQARLPPFALLSASLPHCAAKASGLHMLIPVTGGS